ncbi:hypothetical protein [Streptomyces sp. NPDC060031]|uniref:hypothetical protein n=1 Tax=Streptomyces sp. NPDC060031 TaxID=3347043 RepID=UPI0036913A74
MTEAVFYNDMQPLTDAARAAVAALEHVVTVTVSRTERIHALAVRAVGINEELKGADPTAGPWPSSAYGFRAQTYPAHVAVLGEGVANAVRPGRVAAAVLALAMEGNGP